MAVSDASRSRPAKFPVFPLFLLSCAIAVLFLFFVPSPLADRLASQVCVLMLGRPVELHDVRYEFRGPYLFFRVGEIDLRPVWRDEDTAVSRFVQRYDLDSWLVVKDSRWILKRSGRAWYLRLLGAEAGGATVRGGLRAEEGTVSKWNVAFWLSRSVWGRFPELVEKRFAEDGHGRRLFKLTWNDGRWRLWGCLGPVLEARWQ